MFRSIILLGDGYCNQYHDDDDDDDDHDDGNGDGDGDDGDYDTVADVVGVACV